MRRSLQRLTLAAALATACATPPAAAPAPTPAPAAPAKVAPKPAGDYRRSLGVVTAPAPGVACFSSGSAVERGSPILIFEDGDTPVAKLRATDATCPAERGGHGIDVALKSRTVVEGKGGAVETIAIGVVANGEGVRGLTKDRVDLDGDGKAERFAACTSGEGVHLTIWSGAVGEGARLWHSYVYLGYDTEPTCSEAEWTP